MDDAINNSTKEFQTVSLEEQSRFPHTKVQLALWGVNWPKARGWGKRLAQGLDPNISTAPPSRRKPRNPSSGYGIYGGKDFRYRERMRWERKIYHISYRNQQAIEARFDEIRSGDGQVFSTGRKPSKATKSS